MAAEPKTTSLKLLIEKKTNKVVFAEADKAFVDFICDILTMPMNSIIKLLVKDNDHKAADMVGTLGNVYTSIEALGEEHILPTISKDWVLRPTTTVRVPLLSVFDPPPSGRLKLYSCSHHSSFTDVPGARCPAIATNNCYNWAPSNLIYIAPKSDKANTMTSEGYVKGVVKYMVMDNLEVKPLSLDLITSHLNNISNSMIQKEVQVGPSEGVAVLKASLETQQVLTAVFIDNKYFKSSRLKNKRLYREGIRILYKEGSD